MVSKVNGLVGLELLSHCTLKKKMCVSIFFPLQLFLSLHLSFLCRTMSLRFLSPRTVVRPDFIVVIIMTTTVCAVVFTDC